MTATAPSRSLLYLSRADVAAAAGPGSSLFVAAVTDAFARHARGQTVQPLKPYLRWRPDGHIAPLSEPEYLVGRHRDNQIVISDLGVSGFHARIFRGPHGYVIEDLKSRNGVWLNGTRVYQAVLKQGDALRLGATDFIYEILFSA